MTRTDRGRRLRIAWWGPLAPSESITAWQSAQLLPRLAIHHDVVAVATNSFEASTADLGVPIVTVEAAPPRDRVDIDVFNVEADFTEFGCVHDVLLSRPGVVVLHDQSLLHLYASEYGKGAGLVDEVRFDYGDLPDLERRIERACADNGDPMDLPLLRRVCESTLGVAVHSTRASEELRRRFPFLLVVDVPLAVDVPVAVSSRAAARTRAAAALTVAIIGDDDKRRLAASAADTVRRAGIDVELLDVARADDWLESCNLFVDVTWPSSGGVRRHTAQAVAAGVPAVVASSPHALGPPEGVHWLPLAAEELVARLCSIFTDVALGPARERTAPAPAWLASPRPTALRYAEFLRHAVEQPDPARRSHVTVPSAERVGVNVIGDFDATTGLMEAGRRLLRSLITADVDIALQARSSAAGTSTTRRLPESDALPRGRRFGIDLLLLNVNEMHAVTDEWLRSPGTDRYVIGAWFWELGVLTEHLARHARRVDEVWVASEFVRSAFRGATQRPVVLMPPAVEVLLPPRFDATAFGIRDEALVYFFNFDALSTAARKNPWGVIESFSSAFAPAERRGPVQLVIKVHNLERVSGLAEPLRAAIESVDGLLVDAELNRSEMNGLLGRCDVYASLHRSEGFGLGMAEAMFLGKPVIATAYSGNVDFTLPNTSCLVGYRMRPVTDQDHRHFPEASALYPPGLTWAEPDLEAATRWMRLLYESPELRNRVGADAARVIRERYSPRAQQDAVTTRLQWIQGVGTSASAKV